MGHQASNPVNFDSPSAAAAFGALGITGLEGALDNVSVGQLGALGGIGGGDDGREERLKAVIDLLKQKKGLVSEAGLERLTKSTGLEYLWDEGTINGAKSRTLIIAGSALALDIVLVNNIVQKVSLSFPESSKSVTKDVAKAEQIILEDLKLLPTQSPLTKTLDKFAANLERLAILDKSSVIPGLNTHEAIAGIYESLGRLHRWDIDKLREDGALAGKGDEFLAVTALCTRHGSPVMHARDRVGLSLDYWRERRLQHSHSITNASQASEALKTWALMVSCAPLGGMVYRPVRVSDKWISTEIEKLHPTDEELLSNTTGQPILDWQEPENIILPNADGSKSDASTDLMQAESILSGPKYPEVIFMAKFDPPVAVPYSVWEHVHQLTGATASVTSLETFDILLFPIPPGAHHDPAEPRTIGCTKKVSFVSKDGETSLKTHENTLFIYKPVYGKTLTEVPFSHPRQLVEMLPLLRQYAFLSILLDKSFGPDEWPLDKPVQKPAESTTFTTTVRDDFTGFLNAAGKEGKVQTQSVVKDLKVDVTLTAHPLPRLQVVFPFKGTTANIMVEIQLNGLVHIVSQNILGEDAGHLGDASKGKGRSITQQDLGRVLEMVEDIGKWCEWIRSRLE